MIFYIIYSLPYICIAYYLYCKRSVGAIIKSIIILLVVSSCVNTLVNVPSGLMRIQSGAIFYALLIWSIVLAYKNRKAVTRSKSKLSKEQKTEAFNFKSKRKDLTIANPFRGVLIVGGAGSGKSRTFMYPIIKQSAEKGYTGVLYDFKGPELMNIAEQCYKHYNSPVKIAKIDFKTPSNSQRANPLAYVHSAIHATNYSQALIFNLMPEYILKQDFWSRSMLSIFAGTIWYFKKNAPELATLPHVFAFFFTTSAKEIVEILSQDREVKGYISSLAEAVDQGAEKQVAGVLGTLKNAIGIYNTPEVFWILSSDDVNLNVNDPQNPTMLLVGNNSALSDSYAPLCSLIITVCSKLMNEPGKQKSVLIIDESPTVYLPNFEQIPATARSNKIAVIVGAQDISQMVDKYGREKTEVLMSNLGNQFYGRTTNIQTAQKVVSMFGQQEDIVELTNRERVGIIGYRNKGKSQSIQKRDRVKVQEMTTLAAGEFAGLMTDGKHNEFVEKIQLQKMPGGEIEPLNNGYSLNVAEAQFEAIYSEVQTFLDNNPTSGNGTERSQGKAGYGRVTDMDF